MRVRVSRVLQPKFHAASKDTRHLVRVFVLDAASVASTRSVQIRRDYFSVLDDASVALLSANVLIIKAQGSD